MRINVRLADGSEQTLEVEQVRLSLGGAPVDLSLTGASARLRIASPGDGERWQQFIVHHSAANVMELEVRCHGQPGPG